jgi:hypothetical protein
VPIPTPALSLRCLGLLALGLVAACLLKGGAADTAAPQGAAAAWTAGQNDPVAIYRQALRQQRQGRLREALASLDQALRLKPDLEEARRLKQALLALLQVQGCQALCLAADQDRALGRYEEAERGYRLALRLYPDCWPARAGLSALGWSKQDLENVWQDADRAYPGTAQAQGLRSLLAAARGLDVGGPRPGSLSEASALWSGFVRAGLQRADRAAPAGDQDGNEALFYGRLQLDARAWAASYSYFLDFNRSATGTARVDYHALALQWSPAAVAWTLQLDEAMEWSQGRPAYGHHLAELRRSWEAGGPWRGWTGLQALWENYADSPELNAFGPSAAAGLGGPAPWNGHLGMELRLRGDDTQIWANRDASLGFHAELAWRRGADLSPRLDLDAKSQMFPDWPGGPGRWDRSLDGRFELTLWQRHFFGLSAGDEAWNHASSLAAYSEIGNDIFVAGNFLW